MRLVVIVPATERSEAALMKSSPIDPLDVAVAEGDVVQPTVSRNAGINNLAAQRVCFALDKITVVDVQMSHPTGPFLAVLAV